MAENSSIIVCGQQFDIGCRVVHWYQNGASFYTSGAVTKRDLTLEQLQKRIKLFCIHHSVTRRAKDTYDVLLGRNLSVQFIIDDDVNADTGCSTIWQSADVRDFCWSQRGKNDVGSGVELCYRPDEWTDSTLYSEENNKKYGTQPHKIVDDEIHGTKFKCFAPTEAQTNALIRLIYGYIKAFPALKPEFPKDENGKYIKTVVQNPINLVNHYNLDTQKIDALGLSHEYIEQEVQKLLEQDNKPKSLLDKVFSFLGK